MALIKSDSLVITAVFVMKIVVVVVLLLLLLILVKDFTLAKLPNAIV